MTIQKKHNNKNKLGFSLIELSVVILIVGLLVIGVSKGSRIIIESKIKTAKSLTASSIVNATDDLVLWLDATNEKNIAIGAFNANPLNFDSSINDQSSISSWRSLNPRSSVAINLTTTSDNFRPTYVERGINGLPSVRFDGVNDFLTNSKNIISGGKSAYTIIAVASFDVVKQAVIFAQRIPSDNCTPTGQGSAGGIIYDNVGDIGIFGCGINDFAPADYSLNTPHIISVVSSRLPSTARVYLSSKTSFSATIVGPVDLNSGPIFVGQSGENNLYFDGQISELIVFDRALKNSEIIEIQNYLSQKYRININ